MSVQITGLSPLSGTIGTVVDVYGVNFANTTSIYLSNIQMVVVYISNTHLQFVIPAPAVFQGGTFQADTFVVQSATVISLSGTVKVSVTVTNSDGSTDNWEGFLLHIPTAPPIDTSVYVSSPGSISDFANVVNPNGISVPPSMGTQKDIQATTTTISSTVLTKAGMVYNQPKAVISVPKVAITTTSTNGKNLVDTSSIQSGAVNFVDLAPKKLRSEVT